MQAGEIATWSVAAAVTLGVVIRPWKVPEFYWAVGGAALVVILKLMPLSAAVQAIGEGTDVYFFLVGMMLLAEIARLEGLFDWLANRAVRLAGGSSPKLFLIVYGAGILVTMFLSNDATAVVLTPAVYAATRAAKVEPLPYLLICAFVANAASFILPISNPANLVVFNSGVPQLWQWFGMFALPSLASIVATCVLLGLTQRKELRTKVADAPATELSTPGSVVLAGLALTATVLMVSSANGVNLGLPTLLCGVAVTAVALAVARRSPAVVLAGVSWSVILLVAGLFVVVEAIHRTGALASLAGTLKIYEARSVPLTAMGAGTLVAMAANLINNLPAGLIVATTTQLAHASHEVLGAVLIGIDLGPNLSVTGSLATILWLVALRREGQQVDALRFLKVGAVVMPPALIFSLLAFLIGR